MTTIINIDGQFYKVNNKDNILKICLSLGFDLPYFCWHPILGSVGSCRLCAIKKYDNCKKLTGHVIMSCMSSPTENLYISINDIEIKNFRKNIIELLMINHPHDCPICDAGGSCHLQDMTVMAGHVHRRYNFTKKQYKNQNLGPFISHTMNRCIKCYRCVRFYKDYADGKDFNVFGANNNLYFGRITDGILENECSGNLVEICPTGVFTDKTYSEHFSRKWDMQYAPSICQNCSLGCNITVGERYGYLSSIENRFHEEINHYFICDRGRFGSGYVNSNNRPLKITQKINNQNTFLEHSEAIEKIINLIKKSKKIIGIGSPRASIESNFALKDLVGEENFSIGILNQEKLQIDLIIKILQSKNIYCPTLTEIENYDAILILGEDISITSPRLALSIRQAIKKNLSNVFNNNIPYWNNNAILNLNNKFKNPLFITNIDNTSLDDISSWNYYAPIENQVNFGFILSNYIQNTSSEIFITDNNLLQQIKKIAQILLKAKKPLIISGTNSGSLELISAAYNIVKSLNIYEKHAGLFFVLNTVNSMGIGIINGKSLEEIFNTNLSKIDTLIVMENDLYFQEEKNKLNNIFKNISNIIVIDHQYTDTMKKANIILPSASFFESSGTVINNESRAQRFFQAYNPIFYNKKIQVKASWKWLSELKSKINNKKSNNINLDKIIKNCEVKIPILNGISQAAPKANYKIFNRKFARSPIRYSGRSSMLSNINIHEQKQLEDKDTIFNFSMEGNYDSNIKCSHLPFLWHSGWNSLQSLNKFQKEIGISSKYGPTGIKILNKYNKKPLDMFKYDFKKSLHFKKFTIVPYYSLFYSDSLIQKSKLIKKYFYHQYIIINNLDAINLGIQENFYNCIIEIFCLNNKIHLPLRISKNLHQGLIGLPLGIPGIPLVFLGKTIEKLKVIK
ncbi:NADH-quinone oxidoreductase subunit NuoG [Enterobacteriaceae endosymbiont of Plateumaris braccata]|uniref:NADH-quinone oxidoreductase subunit NuoG n=1 Tax=Enterobacteriaceae endosymbiont of Plateumaris braccata TaxID=2675793 RepID=UPI001448BEC3|nr:NADH-quinone oxidoreductase subunit NuoG [Enterobacteriaceae endosymbiont of Plateumaris braccata]QJC28322.1 NADH-quinone oxidoreductase subunit NuoG [Enterobacteriaceae endosymbiont of Plateumaris braccata]